MAQTKAERRKVRMDRANRYRAAGRCPCGRPIVQGRMRCESCLKSDRKRWAKRGRIQYRARFQLGLCVLCTEPNERIPGSPYCGYHREHKTDNETQRRETHRAAGLCPNCSQAPEPGFKYCAKCRASFAKSSRNQRAKTRQRRAA